MSNNYKPMTADEAAKLSVRPEGTYAFEVIDSVAGVSKVKGDGSGGNPMIALTLSFFDDQGDRFEVKDWLVHSPNRWAEKKVYDFAVNAGCLAKYADGTFAAEDCLGKSGWAKLGIQQGQEKPDGSGRYNDKNSVKYYTGKPEAKAGSPAPLTKIHNESPTDDSIPF